MDTISQEVQVKRTIRDSVFTSLFSNKKYLLQLYKVLHPEDTTADIYYAGDTSAIDVHVRVLQVGKDKNIVTEYCQFTDIYAEQFIKHKRTLKTIKETIRICIERDILKDYLQQHEKEVITMLECLFDQETVFNNFLNTKIYEAENKGIEKGIVQGIEKGIVQGRQEASILSIQKDNQ